MSVGVMYSLRHTPRVLRFSRSLSSSTVPNPLPAAFLRGGTSKGLFINRRHLGDPAEWDSIFLRLMGSPDPQYGRQLDGMGGGISSLSKIVVVGPPSSAAAAAAGVEAEYTFAQVGVRDAVVDYSGNCGNLASMVAPFAVDQRICAARPRPGTGTGTVRIWNTNTLKVIRATFPLTTNFTPALENPEVSIAGVPGTASRILLDFLDPAGARTGTLLPTGRATDILEDDTPLSLVDATNPCVFVSASSLFGHAHLPPADAYTDTALLARLERLRTAGARAMGLDPSTQAQPKLAVLGAPSASGADVDIDVQALSMGVLHRAVPVTLGLCLGVATALEGTVAHTLVQQTRDINPERARQHLVRLRHPSGVIEVGAELTKSMGVTSAKVVRTGRRLMDGTVWW